MKLAAYLRVSTDDKGQDPERQADIIRAWATKNGHEISAFYKDEGTSGGTGALDRPVVKRILKAHKDDPLDGIVVESVDRWTRQGIKALGVDEFFLNLDHGLVLHFADQNPGMDEFAREIIGAIMALCAKEMRRRLRSQIKSGLARSREAGWPNGRPGGQPKEPLSGEELAFVLSQMEAGIGRRKIALALSVKRGAHNLAEPKLRRQREITEGWLADQIEAKCRMDQSISLRVKPYWPALLQTIQVSIPQPEGGA